MSRYYYFVGLLLALTLALTHARSIPLASIDQLIDDASVYNDQQQREVYYLNRIPPKSAVNPKAVFIRIGNGHHFPYEHESPVAFARHAKAIVKGDPREFMG